jgi:hypothetical protein
MRGVALAIAAVQAGPAILEVDLCGSCTAVAFHLQRTFLYSVYKDGSGLSEEEEDGSELWQGLIGSACNPNLYKEYSTTTKGGLSVLHGPGVYRVGGLAPRPASAEGELAEKCLSLTADLPRLRKLLQRYADQPDERMSQKAKPKAIIDWVNKFERKPKFLGSSAFARRFCAAAEACVIASDELGSGSRRLDEEF